MEYVAGFAFSEDRSGVLLVEKQKPDFQRGKLNGIGGKILDEEAPIDAMVREFREETGIDTLKNNWRRVVDMQGTDWRIVFYRAFFNDCVLINRDGTTNDVGETLRYLSNWKNDLRTIHTLQNVQWLIPMAADTTIEVPVFISDSV